MQALDSRAFSRKSHIKNKPLDRVIVITVSRMFAGVKRVQTESGAKDSKCFVLNVGRDCARIYTTAASKRRQALENRGRNHAQEWLRPSRAD